jgi:hypothetical protein
MTRTIIAQDGQPVSTKLEKVAAHWVVNLESETFAARVPLTPFIASLLARKASKGCVA